MQTIVICANYLRIYRLTHERLGCIWDWLGPLTLKYWDYMAFMGIDWDWLGVCVDLLRFIGRVCCFIGFATVVNRFKNYDKLGISLPQTNLRMIENRLCFFAPFCIMSRSTLLWWPLWHWTQGLSAHALSACLPPKRSLCRNGEYPLMGWQSQKVTGKIVQNMGISWEYPSRWCFLAGKIVIEL